MAKQPIRTFFGTETTGLSNAKIIEIALVWRNDATMEQNVWYSLLNPNGTPIQYGAYKVYKISEAMVRNNPKFKDDVDDIIRFVGRAKIVAHNAKFDSRMLNKELNCCGKPEIAEYFLNLHIMSEAIYGKGKGVNTLDAACARHGVDLTTRSDCHGALIDTLLLADVYPFLYSSRLLQQG